MILHRASGGKRGSDSLPTRKEEFEGFSRKLFKVSLNRRRRY